MKTWGLIILSVMAATATAQESQLYLVGKYKLAGASYTQVVFFQDEEVPDRAACEKERIRGRNGKWRYYRHVVNYNSRIPFTVNYFCTETPLAFENWSDNNLYDYVYLVDLRGDALQVRQTDTIAECLDRLRDTQPKESRHLESGDSTLAVMCLSASR